MEHEGAAMYDAAVALRDAMISLGLACDGGKDSLSMAASAGGEVLHIHCILWHILRAASTACSLCSTYEDVYQAEMLYDLAVPCDSLC
jgi:hypothetical protein